MKTVSNRACAEQFAQNALSMEMVEVQGNGSIFIRGRTIYSYGDHHPIATITKRGQVRLNVDRVSNTTSKQTGQVAGACSAIGVQIIRYSKKMEEDPHYRAAVEDAELRRNAQYSAREQARMAKIRSHLAKGSKRAQIEGFTGERRMVLAQEADDGAT